MKNGTYYIDEELNEFDNFFKGKKRRSCEDEAKAQGKNKRQARIQCRTELGGSAIGRGAKKVLTLDPRVASAVRNAIRTLCEVYDIPMNVPRGSNGQSETGDFYHGVVDKDYLINGFRGVIGHHHITKNKWDCACWWETIFND